MKQPIKNTIKNIFWDVDGVLVDLNFAYFNLLTNHPNYKDMYRGLKWEELPKVLPISPEIGALELETHPTLGMQMDYDFTRTPEFFVNRPLYPNVVETLRQLDKLGYRQFTMSATSLSVEAKKEFVSNVLADAKDFLTVECVFHDNLTEKEDSLKSCLEKYGLKAEETILVDDRIYNIYSAMRAGIYTVRLKSEFTTDLPADLDWVVEVKDIVELKNWLLDEENNG